MSLAAVRSRAPSMVLLGGLAIVLTLFGTALFGSKYDLGEVVFFGLALCYFLVLGALVLDRAHGNRIGWLFVVMAFSIGISGILEPRAESGYFALAAIAGALWMLWIGLVPLLFFWFPTGRPPTPRWRLVEVVLLGAIAFVFFTALFTESLCRDGDAGTCHEWVANPIGIAGVPHPEYSGLIGATLVLAIVVSVAALIWRYRIAGSTERLQLKWFLLATALFVASIGGETIYEVFFSRAAPVWVDVLNYIAIPGIPVAATVAILRYRLYDIDRIISRTVSYGLVVGLLGLAVAGVAAVAGSQFETPWVVAATTLGMAALFNPVRRRVQVWVDRRFNRSRYDVQRVMDEFAGSLRDRVDVGEVVEGWLGVVDSTMEPSVLSVWVRP